MIVALIIGKHKSMGCPGKNTRLCLGRPMVEYSFLAAKHSPSIDKIFTSTDSPQIAEIGKKYGAEHIERPAHLATPEALTEDALLHAFDEMSKRCDEEISIVSLFFANAPNINVQLVEDGISVLRANESLDSAVSVCQYDQWAPLRARKLVDGNTIAPYVPLESFGKTSEMSSIRGGEGGCYFCDLSTQILKRRCFTNMSEGSLPFLWHGQNIYALINDFGFDIDYEWQIPVLEHWLLTHGFSEESTPYEND
jgi:CMP-N-acetylneuraminic acid synthetase